MYECIGSNSENIGVVMSLFECLKSNTETANAIAAISGVFVSTLALLVSVSSVLYTRRAIKQQRQHKELSVRPLLYLGVGDYENSIFVSIRNNGNGPLILKDIKVTKGNAQYSTLVAAMPEVACWSHFIGEANNRSIRAGEETILLKLEESLENDRFCEERQAVRAALSNSHINIKYLGIYDDQEFEYSQDLSWFARRV